MLIMSGGNDAMKAYRYHTLREKPELMPAAAEWFHQKWGIPAEAYRTCMDSYLRNATELGWYLCLAEERIIGGLGVIENDFHSRRDLTPNICAVYTEEEYRRQGIAETPCSMRHCSGRPLRISELCLTRIILTVYYMIIC